MLRRPHFAVAWGKLVYDESGAAVLDDAPILQAVQVLIRLEERKARILGYESPVKRSVEVQVFSEGMAQRAIAQLRAQLEDAGELDLVELEPIDIDEGPDHD